MKKKKVALQFISEILIVTLMAVIIGGAAGAVSSVPVTNALLESQIAATQEANDSISDNFGRPSFPGNPPSDMTNNDTSTAESNTQTGQNDSTVQEDGSADSTQQAPGRAQYISSVSGAVNIKVLAELLGIGVLLAAAGAAVSVSAIMRYEPLKILAGRD